MLIVTSAIVVVIEFVPVLNKWFKSLGIWGMIGFLIGFVVVCLIVNFSAFVRHTVPINYIAMFILCCLEGCLLGAVTTHYTTSATLIALGGTLGICFVLTVFATQVRYDFTVCRGLVIVMIVIMLVMGIAAIFIHNKIYHLVFSGIGLAFFSFMLVFDIQMMIGGQHKYVNDPDEPLISAIALYIDIIMIFLHLLNILGLTGN